MVAFYDFKPASQVVEEEEAPRAAQEELEKRKESVVTALSAHIQKKFETAKSSKRKVEDQFLANLRARKREYEPGMIAALKQMFGPEYEAVFAPIIETKCSAAESWIKEIFFQKGERPWELAPTPLPELPESVTAIVKGLVAEQVAMGEMEMSDDVVEQQVATLMPDVEEQVIKVIEGIAKKSAVRVSRKIEDMFKEGGWEEALHDCIYDIVTFGTMIMKGPFVQKVRVRKKDFDPYTGKWITTYKDVLREYWARVNPFDMYPLPGTTNPQNGDFIEIVRFTRRELSNLFGVRGWKEDAIREVLREHRYTGRVEWKSSDQERILLEGKESTDLHESEQIECVKYHGSAPGYALREWGMSPSEVPDEEMEYDIVAWQIGKHVIKSIINPDPLGGRPYFTAGFREIPDSFWHTGVPQLAESAQRLGNATLRSIAINVALASGPQVEVDVERLAPGEKLRIWPYRVWPATNQQLREGQAVNFFQPQIVVKPLMDVFEMALRMADEDTGVPRYAHGDPRTTGATETASGLSMMMSQSAKGIKMVVKNIDDGVISPSVEYAYNYLMQYDGNMNVIGDLIAVATGSYALMAREQQAIRRTEFLVQTANPFDMQVMGVNGRAELLKQALKSLDIDPDRVIKDDQVEMANASMSPQNMPRNDAGAGAAPTPAPMGMQEAPPPPAPVEVDASGAPVAGRDTQAFQSRPGVTP